MRLQYLPKNDAGFNRISTPGINFADADGMAYCFAGEPGDSAGKDRNYAGSNRRVMRG
jgi:hypothetical protein